MLDGKGEMDLVRVQRKIAEAHFFLRHMIEQERRLVGDRESFDYYLSAFLSAGRTVDYRLRHAQKATYPEWRTGWDTGLSPQESALIKFMVDDRNDEVHASGSSRSVTQEGVPLPLGESRIDGGIFYISGPPGMPPPVADKPSYKFTIDGVEREATETCSAYLVLLQRMVAEFEAAHP
jgi:hypothetical protein